MITYKSIINACKAFADKHHVIEGFGNGELWQISDHDQDGTFNYPLMYMVDVSSSPGSSSWIYAFRVYFVSRVEAPKDRAGNPIYFEYASEKSAMIACAQDFLSYWVQDVNYQMTIDKSLGVTTFIDAQEDGVTGCYVDIRFVVPFDYNSCIIPMDDVPTPRLLCLPVSLSLDNTTIASIASGDSYNITLKDIDGNPVVWSYNEPLKILTIQLGACNPVTMTYNGVSITSTAAGGTKTITVLSESLDPVGTITVDTSGQLTVIIANATIVNQSPGATWTDTVYASGSYILQPQPWINSDGSAQSTPYDPATPIVCTPANIYDPSAQALFDRVLELEPIYGVAESFKPIINALIIACKQSGKWYEEQFWMTTYVPTLNVFATLIEIKSLSIQATFADTSVMAPPYNIALRVGTTSSGFAFRSTGYLNMGFIPSSKMILNDSCAGIMTYSDETGAATFNFGALVSTSQSTAFSKKLNTNAMVADVYGTTTGIGRVIVVGASGAKGWTYVNRIATIAEIVENESTVGSHTGTQGTLPNITEFAGTFNNAGTPSTRRLQSAIVMLFKMRGMTTPQKAIMHPALTAYQTDSKMKAGLEDILIVLASNSHGVYWHGATQRSIDFHTYAQGVKVVNVSISGRQTLSTIGAATGLIPSYTTDVEPLYDPSLSENWVYLNEGTNDLWFNGDLEAAKANYITYVNLCHATGFLVKAPLIMCRKFTGNPGGLTETQFNIVINDFNVWLDGGGSGADAIVPQDAETFVFKGSMSDAEYNAACAVIYSNASIFYDASTIGTHLVESKYLEWGKQMLDAN